MWNLAWITKTAVGVLYVNFAFLVLYFPRFILLAARVITGPNIITTSFFTLHAYAYFLQFITRPCHLRLEDEKNSTRYNGHTTKSIHQS